MQPIDWVLSSVSLLAVLGRGNARLWMAGFCVGLWLCGIAGAKAEGFPEWPSVYAHYAADHPGNLTVPALKQEFLAAAVDVAGGKLKLPDLGFAAMTYPKGLGFATPVYFSSTGRLPSPLREATPYYVVPAEDGGYRVYPQAVDADALLQPGGVLGEKVLPAQNVAQGVGSVVFSDAGTGTHTLYTKTLISQLTDLTANGLHSLARRPANKHSLLEMDTDDQGRIFIRTAGALERENFVGSYSAYGPGYVQGPSEKRYEARQMVEARRVVYQIFVGRIRSFKERQVLKFMAGPKDVSVESNEIVYGTDHRVANRVNNGDLVLVKAYPGGRLPAPLREGVDYYARKRGEKILTLHPSVKDALEKSNAIDLSDSGEGDFLFWLPERVGDSRRWSFFAEILAPDSGGNTLSARLQEPVAQGGGVLKNEANFVTRGNSNGNISGLASVLDLSPVSLWTPPRAVLPEPLQAGVRYWVSKAPGSGNVARLHSTLAGARESVGRETTASSCIKFTAPGRGESLASYDDGAAAIAYGSLQRGLDPFATRVPLGPLCVLVFKIDFNPPERASICATLGVNEAVTEGKLLDYQRGLTPAAKKEGYPAWTMFNSAQGHVPIDMDLYEVVFGSSAGEVPDGDLQKMVDYFKAKYGIEKEPARGIP